MNRLTELAAKLTPAQLKEVEDFAEFLLSRQMQAAQPQEKQPRAARGEYLDVDAIAGMFAGLAPEKTAVELAHEATEIRAAKYLK